VTEAGPRHLAVARLRKPHGLKGDVVLFPLTDDPSTVLAAGRRLWVMDLAGSIVGGPLEIERSRAYHREWLVKFAGIEGRDALQPLRAHFLAADAAELTPPSGDEVYLHELEGFAVRLEDRTPVGLVSSVYDMPTGVMIEVQGARREFLLPYRKEFVLEVDRSGRALVVRPPAGLLDE
jgi:16S rRNA processing protein RimM